jgi:hypothetical protein
MMPILRILDAILVPSLLVTAIALGFYLPFRLLGGRPGFVHGVGFCSVFTLLCSAILAYLFGGWGEHYLGTRWGVPIGVLVGGLSASILLNSVAGIIGSLLYAVFVHR